METEAIDIEPQIRTSERLKGLKEAVMNYPHSICIERATLITDYFKNKADKKKPIIVQKAKALAYVLEHKAVKIYPDELIVGNTTSLRVAGPIYPELHGLAMMEDVFNFNDRELNPLKLSKKNKTKFLKEVVPYWLTKNITYKSFSTIEMLKFVQDQLNPKFYLINETGGIGHFVPNFEQLINKGLDGIMDNITDHYKSHFKNAEIKEKRHRVYDAMLIICDGVMNLASNYSKEALKMAKTEIDEKRKQELHTIADNLKQVPFKPARTFHEAVQSVWLLQTALLLEGLDNGLSFGRPDQYLYPFYKRDIENGMLTPERAKEILGCFAIKSSEVIPIFSKKLTECHGGLLSGQALTIGGVDKNGNDVTNDLSYLFLELMDEVRMRQPNYHARVHPGSPKKYIDKIMSNLVKGVNSPAVFNDEVIIDSLEKCGFSDDDAKEYATLGCVEFSAPGKTFGSTDAALVNLPICLEMALNQGKLFKRGLLASGCNTPKPESFKNIDEVKAAFKAQLQFVIDRLVKVLAPIEIGNRDYHPTPLISSLTEGCIETGQDVTEGGAIYNFSGVQGVGVTDVGDSLYAINELVFVKQKYTLSQIIKILKNNFKGNEKMRLEMLNLAKFGNDNKEVDAYSSWVANTYYDSFNNKVNTRGGLFVAGYYSTTTHYSFGSHTGALPSGRQKGKPFTSGIAPMNGYDRKGPTALFNSVSSIDFSRAHNGANVNAKFDMATLKGEHGIAILESLILTYFKKGGMQLQLNVLDAKMLEDAKAHPEKYGWLVVRVSGYSAYFNDLSPAMKDEIIQRSTLSC